MDKEGRKWAKNQMPNPIPNEKFDLLPFMAMTIYHIVTRAHLTWRPLGRVRARAKVSCEICHLMSCDQDQASFFVYKGSFTILRSQLRVKRSNIKIIFR